MNILDKELNYNTFIEAIELVFDTPVFHHAKMNTEENRIESICLIKNTMYSIGDSNDGSMWRMLKINSYECMEAPKGYTLEQTITLLAGFADKLNGE